MISTSGPRRPRRPQPTRLLVALAATVGLLAPAVPATAAVGEPVTYLGHTYSSTVTRPSADKPQSKLWYLDGAWWALMVGAGGSQVYIHELLPDHTWRTTGTLVDSRLNSSGDALWSARDGRLYVASRVSGENLKVAAFTYSSATRSWAVAPGFPVSVNSGGGSESASIDQDSLGRLWVTYTRGSRVWVARSDPAGGNWTAGFLPSVVDTSIKSDDLSAVIAFGSSVGVMYSDQVTGRFWFAIHDDADPDDVWRLEDATATLSSVDDHINLKQLVGDPQGRIFAAVKTAANDVAGAPASAPLVGVLSRSGPSDGQGTWAFATAGTIADDHTRPIIMVDATHQELYFLATSPGNGGDIVHKKSPLSTISFPTGRGAPFVDAKPVVNNASGAKEPVTAQTGLVVLAVAEGQKRYVHAEMDLGGGDGGGGGGGDVAPPTVGTSPSAGATEVAVGTSAVATFSEAVQGVTTSTFTLTTDGGSPVPAALTSDPSGTAWTLDPASDLAAGAVYTVTLTGGPDAIRDLAGNALETESSSFTTATAAEPPGDSVEPTVTAKTPAPGATRFSRTGNVTVTFSEPVQDVTTETFVLRNSATGAVVTAVVKRSKDTNKYVLNPSATLPARTSFTATVVGGASGVADLAGNRLAADVGWSFTTRA
ncbi:Ig-like domain-containing protein [Blastococcus sp. BMG 814]|uniref:Ig-like domain-containing protein n=1 Tax=Blastococcus carthaginiensis TaxID=3050034 RepID=A0ABT9IF06_9ACTN|nr:Ig-like domain-containing protein [Blastococcus carthaginiensis]MDP5183777.1 Ig-like domain-containing protein [Blastococcus carthaginiensis]